MQTTENSVSFGTDKGARTHLPVRTNTRAA